MEAFHLVRALMEHFLEVSPTFSDLVYFFDFVLALYITLNFFGGFLTNVILAGHERAKQFKPSTIHSSEIRGLAHVIFHPNTSKFALFHVYENPCIFPPFSLRTTLLFSLLVPWLCKAFMS